MSNIWFDLNIPRDQPHSHRQSPVDILHKFGANADVATAYETIWSEGGDKTFLTAAASMTISSASADDTSAGTGARTVTVQGVDNDWNEISETATLNGQTGVNLANDYLCVHRMVVNTAGSGVKNAGIVYVGSGSITTGKPATVECSIDAGENQSEVAFYAVPAGKRLAVTYFHFAIGANKYVTAGLYIRPIGGVFNLKGKVKGDQGYGSYVFDPCLEVTEKQIVQVRALIDSTTGDVTAGFSGYLL